MTRCARPDCQGGVLDGDEMCTTCFRGPEFTGKALPLPTKRSCPRPDCRGGTYDESGICDRCWREEPATGWLPPRLTERPPADPPVWWRADDRLTDPGQSPREPVVTPVGSPGRALARSELGLGLVDIESPAQVDPMSQLLADSDIVERERRCPDPACAAVLGTEASPTPAQGSCPKCGTAFSFRPALRPGEQLSAQYKIEGSIGYGGQGQVYLARDLNLDNEYVAVKGLRGDMDHNAMDGLADEKRTLIQVRHPDIVDIRNFLSRRQGAAGEQFDVFIVLEFISGVTLNDKKLRTNKVFRPGEAISYVLATLPALGYLHDSKLVYGDFKPANVMHVGDRVKLIDLGAVRAIGTRAGDAPWTVGYRAPESETAPPSTAADLYSVGRTLASLTADFDMAGPEYLHSLPQPHDLPGLAEHESFYRFLLKATAREPEHRFTSAAQMAEQLTGVLREVVAAGGAAETVRSNPAPSALFTHERDTVRFGVRERLTGRKAALALPLPLPRDGDPASATLSALGAAEPDDVVRALEGRPATDGTAFRLVLAHIARKAMPEARHELATVRERDWRYVWHCGLVELADDAPRKAWREFAAIRDALPGESAPKLALAACAELLDEFKLARHYYRTVWRTDSGYVSAAFGLARAYGLQSLEDPGTSATEVLEQVPEQHHRHVEAALAAIRLRLGSRDLDAQKLREAAGLLQQLELPGNSEEYLDIRIEVFDRARKLRAADDRAFGTEPLLDVAVGDDKFGMEIARLYLALRPTRSKRHERVNLVKQAHEARPWTFW